MTHLGNLELVSTFSVFCIVLEPLWAGKLMVARRSYADIPLTRDLTSETGDRTSDYQRQRKAVSSAMDLIEIKKD